MLRFSSKMNTGDIKLSAIIEAVISLNTQVHMFSMVLCSDVNVIVNRPYVYNCVV